MFIQEHFALMEFGVRIVLAGLVVLIAGWTGTPPFAAALPIAIVFAAYSAGLAELDRRSQRTIPWSGLASVADSLSIALLLGACHAIPQFGFLAALPVLDAARRRAVPSLAIAPGAALAVFMGYSIYNSGDAPFSIYGQALGVLLIGGLVYTKPEPEAPRTYIGTSNPLVGEEPDSFLGLREAFRRVRDLYRELERQSQRDRRVARLLETKFSPERKLYAELAARVGQLSGAETVALYDFSEAGESFALRAAWGPNHDFPGRVAVANAASADQTRILVEQALIARLGGERPYGLLPSLLYHHGRLVGMVITTAATDTWDSVRDAVSELTPILAGLVYQEQHRCDDRDEMATVRLRYELASGIEGVREELDLYTRFAYQVSRLFAVDTIAIEGAAYEHLHGEPIAVSDLLKQPEAGREVIVIDARSDDRCDTQESVRRRVGSFALFPVAGRRMAFIFRNSGILDERMADRLRIAMAELTRAVYRVRSEQQHTEGWVNNATFAKGLAEPGVLIYVEPVRSGVPRDFVHRMRAMLPAGATLLERAEGDFVAYLRHADETDATRWANDLMAQAVLFGQAIGQPFAVRARVAPLGIRTNVIAIQDSREPLTLLEGSKQ